VSKSTATRQLSETDLFSFKAMDAVQILGELQNFLETRISTNEHELKTVQEDTILNVHLVGQGLAYREMRCFLEHRIKSHKEDEK
jgi:hypothetical protein